MADLTGITVPEMPSASTINGADYFMIVQSGVNKKITQALVLGDYYNKSQIDQKISAVYKYKGSVATYQDLPDTDLTIGDVYNVQSDGNNYAWTGTEWDKLGGDIDLSNYYTKSEIDGMIGNINNAIDVINGEVI